MLVLRDALRVPGLLSLSRLALGAAFPFVWSRPAAAVALLIASAATDVLDGYWARRFHQTTETGAALDAVMDKVFALFVMGTLLVVRAMSPIEALLLSTRELVELPLVPYVLARRMGARQRSNVPGKITTALQFTSIFVVLTSLPYRGVAIAIAAIAGVLAGAAYWARALRQRSDPKAAPARSASLRAAREAPRADPGT